MSFSDFMDSISQNPELWPAYIVGLFSGSLVFFSIDLVNAVLHFIEWLTDKFSKSSNGNKNKLRLPLRDYFRLFRSDKLTNKQRLELLESKIDSLADIVISSSPEVK